VATILGANIYDSGRRSAFLKVIAHMHGLKLEEVESEDARRRRRNRRRVVAASIALAALLALGGWFYWDNYVPKTAYFVDYVERYGVPEGVGPLKKTELEGINAFYAIEEKDHVVTELRCENAIGHLMTPEEECFADHPSRAVYSHKENGDLDHVTHYNARNGR